MPYPDISGLPTFTTGQTATAASQTAQNTAIANAAYGVTSALYMLGDGHDGPGYIASLSALSGTPTLAGASGNENDMSGLGACKVKYAYGNLSGMTAASSASGSVTPTNAQRLAMTGYDNVPASAGFMDVFVQTGGAGDYMFARRVPAQDITNGGTIYIDQTVFDPNYTAPGSNTTSATAATVSGTLDLTALTLTNGQTLTVGNSGANGGLLVLRIQGDCDIQSGATVTADGAGRVLFDLSQTSRSPGTWGGGGGVPDTTSSGGTDTGEGIGANPYIWFFQAPGTQSNDAPLVAGSYTAGDAGWPGGTIVIAAKTWSTMAGTISADGQTAPASSGSGTGAAPGAGGGGGGKITLISLNPVEVTGTIRARGGTGGAAAGSGGASTAQGGSGGGGGMIVFCGPIWDTSGGTVQVTGGSAGANDTDASAAKNAGGGGGSAGAGGASGGTKAAGSSGQTIDLTIEHGARLLALI